MLLLFGELLRVLRQPVVVVVVLLHKDCTSKQTPTNLRCMMEMMEMLMLVPI